MSNRKTKTIAKQSGSVGVFWDKLRGGETSLIGERIPKMTLDKAAVQSLTKGLTGWYEPSQTKRDEPKNTIAAFLDKQKEG